MKYYYGEFDGEEFPTGENLFGFDQLMDFIMQYGDQAMKALEQMMKNPKNDEQSELLKQLLEEGMLDKDGKGKLRLTPRSVGKMQRRALMEVFANLRNGSRDGHEKVTAGANGERIDGTKPYQFGDPVSELDLHQTLHNAMARHGVPKGRHSGAAGQDHVRREGLRAAPARGDDQLQHGRAAGHERLHDAVRPVPLGQEGRPGHAGVDPPAVPAGQHRLRRLLLRAPTRSPRRWSR